MNSWVSSELSADHLTSIRWTGSSVNWALRRPGSEANRRMLELDATPPTPPLLGWIAIDESISSANLFHPHTNKNKNKRKKANQ
jgi:hypothetical protein